MQKSCPLLWESKRNMAVLANEPIASLRVQQHVAQPPASLDILMAEGWGVRVLSRMEYVDGRFEVGRLVVQDLQYEELEPNRDANSRWIAHETHAPKWLSKPRRVEMLTYSDDQVSVDSGLRLSSGLDELIVVASSFPCCLEIKMTGAEILTGPGDVENFRPEFELDELTHRQV